MEIKNNYIKFRNALTKNEFQKAEEFFQKAFEDAFALYQLKLSNNEKFNLNNENELFAVLVLTDNLIGFWKEGMIEEAIAFCESMVELVSSAKLKEMFKGYSFGISKGIDVDTFFKNYVDLAKIDEEFPQFLCNFKEDIKELLK